MTPLAMKRALLRYCRGTKIPYHLDDSGKVSILGVFFSFSPDGYVCMRCPGAPGILHSASVNIFYVDPESVVRKLVRYYKCHQNAPEYVIKNNRLYHRRLSIRTFSGDLFSQPDS